LENFLWSGHGGLTQTNPLLNMLLAVTLAGVNSTVRLYRWRM